MTISICCTSSGVVPSSGSVGVVVVVPLDCVAMSATFPVVGGLIDAAGCTAVEWTV